MTDDHPEMALSPSETLRVFAQVVQHWPDLVSVVDRQYVYRVVNPAYGRAHGRAADEIVGRTVTELHGETTFENIIGPNLARCFAGQSVRYEDWFNPAAVGRRCMEVHCYPLPGAAGAEYAITVSRDITDRKRTEEERARQAAGAGADAALRRIADILESITDAFYALDNQWRVTYVNAEAERLLGKRRDALLGRKILEEFPDAAGSEFERQYRRAASEHHPVRFDSFYAPLGRWFDVTAYPSKEGLSVYFRDITAQKRTEQELRESKERFRELVETTSDWLWEVGEDGAYTYVSPRVRHLLGYEPEELLGRTPFELMPPEEARRVAEAFARIAAQRTPFASLENTNRHRDGHLVVLETSGVPLFDAAGRFRGYRGIDRDITERKRLERERERLLEEIRRRAAELDAVITSIPDAVGIVDAQGRIVRLNPAAERILGYTPEERQLPQPDRVARLRIEMPDGRPFPAEALPTARALRGETSSGVFLILGDRRTGQAMWLSASAAPIPGPDGRILGAVTVFTDITKLQRLQEQRDDFIRMVSHDLRNPMQVLRAQAEILQRFAGQPDAVRQSAATVRMSVQRMNALLQDLVDSVQSEDGQPYLERQPVALGPFLADLLERSQEVLEARRVKADIPNDVPPVLADPNRLDRIVTNLISNALKYSAPGTEVRVDAATTAEGVQVSVKDSGAGIAPDDLPHVFERYFRARSPRTPEGLGLGLYITRMLVVAHGGSIRVESTPGEGSTFYFTLPPAQAPPLAGAGSRRRRTP
jgi:PAS domain S-box-containing protein